MVKLNTSKQTRDVIKLKRKKIPYFIKNGLYKFESFDDVCAFCKAADINSILDTKLYSYNDNYYLKAGMMPATSILEYADIEKTSALTESRLLEYGNVIIENDVINTINNFFNKKKTRKRKA